MLAIAAFTLGCQNATTTAANVDANAANTTTAPPPPAAAPTDEAPRITLVDAKADYDAGKAIFVDTRPEETYKTEHIKGAINISQDKLESKIGSLSKDKKIIAYCS